MNATRWGVAAATTLGAGGAVLVGWHFENGDHDWFLIGMAALLAAVILGVCAYFARNRHHLDDAFDAGYQSGFHRGQRVKPKVIRLPTERRREPSSRQ